MKYEYVVNAAEQFMKLAEEIAVKFQRPECPKCGTKAVIIVLTKARVKCELNDDGSAGRVLSASRKDSIVNGYECRGGHFWQEMS